MTLQSRLASLITNIGADVKNLTTLANQSIPISTIPSEVGYLDFNCPIESMASTSTFNAGTLHLMRFKNRRNTSITVSSATVILGAAGASLTNVGFCLYSSTGVLLTSSVNANGATAAAFQVSNPRTVTFPIPQVMLSGMSYYIGFWMTGTTMPSLYRSTGTNTVSNFGYAAGAYKFATADTGLTTTPPATFGTQTSLGAGFFCAVA